MSVRSLLAAAALFAAPAAANAAAIGLTGTDGALPILALTGAGLPGTASLSGGTVYGATVLNVAAQPVGTSGNFLAAGPAAGNPATLSFLTPEAYVSFLYGSPDLYNTLTVATNLGPATVFTGAQLVALALGGASQYLQFQTTLPGEFITSISFNSTQNAFESSNYRVSRIVPGPVAGVGILSLLGFVGASFARSRRARVAV